MKPWFCKLVLCSAALVLLGGTYWFLSIALLYIAATKEIK